MGSEKMGQDEGAPFHCVNRRLIMQAHLNAAERLFGGMLMAWVDESAALFTMELIGSTRIVTKKISEVIFEEPAYPGDILEFRFRVGDIGRTSVTLECQVIARSLGDRGKDRLILGCDVVFVALDRNGRPSPHGLTLEAARARGC